MPIGQPEIATVLARLDRLERANRRWRAAAIVSLCAIGTGLLCAATRRSAGGTLSVRSLTITDAAGKVLAQLGVERACAGCRPLPGLFLFGPGGKVDAYLEGGSSGPALGTATGPALYLNSDKQGAIVMPGVLSATGEGTEATITTSAPGWAVIRVASASGIASVHSYPAALGGAGIELQAAGGWFAKDLIDLDASDPGGPGLRIYDPKGKCPPPQGAICLPEVALYTDGEGPRLSLAGLRGFSTSVGVTDLQSIAMGGTMKTSAASIVMFGNSKDRHVIWQAPNQ